MGTRNERNFVFINTEELIRLSKNGVTSKEIADLTMIATKINYNNCIMSTERTSIDKKNLFSLIRATNRCRFKETIDKFIEQNVLCIRDKEYYLSKNVAIRGKVLGYYGRYIPIFTKKYQEIYNNMIVASTKRLGYLVLFLNYFDEYNQSITIKTSEILKTLIIEKSTWSRAVEFLIKEEILFKDKNNYQILNLIKNISKDESLSELNMRKWIEKSKKSAMFKSFQLYKIFCWNESESFYKIGITYCGLKNRFSNNKKMPYNYKIIDVVESLDGEYIWELERELHRKHKDAMKSYSPKLNFGGCGECYTELLVNDINNSNYKLIEIKEEYYEIAIKILTEQGIISIDKV